MAMKKFTSIIVIALCSLSALVACRDTQEKEVLFFEMYPIQEMNTKIRFWPQSKQAENLRPCKIADLTLENLSTDRIVFTNDFGLKIFFFDQQANEWQEIRNSAIYIPEGNPRLSPKGADNPFGVTGIPFVAAASNCEISIEVRVVVIGEVYEDDTPTGVSAGAYIDVTLIP